MAFKHTIVDKNRKEVTYENLSAGRAIRLHCLECSNHSPETVRVCSQPYCPLYPFRFGKTRPKRELSPEQQKIMSERLAKSLGR